MCSVLSTCGICNKYPGIYCDYKLEGKRLQYIAVNQKWNANWCNSLVIWVRTAPRNNMFIMSPALERICIRNVLPFSRPSKLFLNNLATSIKQLLQSFNTHKYIKTRPPPPASFETWLRTQIPAGACCFGVLCHWQQWCWKQYYGFSRRSPSVILQSVVERISAP